MLHSRPATADDSPPPKRMREGAVGRIADADNNLKQTPPPFFVDSSPEGSVSDADQDSAQAVEHLLQIQQPSSGDAISTCPAADVGDSVESLTQFAIKFPSWPGYGNVLKAMGVSHSRLERYMNHNDRNSLSISNITDRITWGTGVLCHTLTDNNQSCELYAVGALQDYLFTASAARRDVRSHVSLALLRDVDRSALNNLLARAEPPVAPPALYVQSTRRGEVGGQ
ncbi:hypothetical protein C8Q76DRAFT_799887 [Earliella scabrosa]|nr:hypothetical protein C8Q76DRAFT_799887 [Earliella scabrosa]